MQTFLSLSVRPAEMRTGLGTSIRMAYTPSELQAMLAKTYLKEGKVTSNMIAVDIYGIKRFAQQQTTDTPYSSRKGVLVFTSNIGLCHRLLLKKDGDTCNLIRSKTQPKYKLPCFYLKPAKFHVAWFFATTRSWLRCHIHYGTNVSFILPLRGSTPYIPTHKCEGFTARFGNQVLFLWDALTNPRGINSLEPICDPILKENTERTKRSILNRYQ